MTDQSSGPLADGAHQPVVGLPVYGRGRFPVMRGHRMCRGCGGPIVETRRQTWCTQACKEKFDPFYVRRAVVARDKHVCQMCGMDIEAAVNEWRKTMATVTGLKRRELSWKKPQEEYDHIVPFCEGGLTTPENMRTLCHACHVKRTTEWRRARAEARRLARQPELFAPV